MRTKALSETRTSKAVSVFSQSFSHGSSSRVISQPEVAVPVVAHRDHSAPVEVGIIPSMMQEAEDIFQAGERQEWSLFYRLLHAMTRPLSVCQLQRILPSLYTFYSLTRLRDGTGPQDCLEAFSRVYPRHMTSVDAVVMMKPLSNLLRPIQIKTASFPSLQCSYASLESLLKSAPLDSDVLTSILLCVTCQLSARPTLTSRRHT